MQVGVDGGTAIWKALTTLKWDLMRMKCGKVLALPQWVVSTGINPTIIHFYVSSLCQTTKIGHQVHQQTRSWIPLCKMAV